MDTNFLLWCLGVIVGFIGALFFEFLSCIYVFYKDRARYLDKKDYKAFNKWKETHEDVKSW